MHAHSSEDGLAIARTETGFYKGFNRTVTIGSKMLISLLVLWAVIWPPQAAAMLWTLQQLALEHFGHWYIYVTALFFIACFSIALLPATGRIRLGSANSRPEFSRFSWFSMMFGAGIGIGMLTYATAEPIYHFSNNPDVIQGLVAPRQAQTLDSVYRYSFLHWGLNAWCTYALAGLALAYFGYNRGLPLTIRSSLTPLFGQRLNGALGHCVDITAVLATLLGMAVTIGFGISQFASGLYSITGASWMVNHGQPANSAMLVSLAVVMGLSTLSALSGVGKGVKWLSNLNMGLSVLLLLFFLLAGATVLSFELLFHGIVDYGSTLLPMIFHVAPAGTALADWQAEWTIFYWAWWIAFAPFVGMFFARISHGRTIREFVLGAVLVPSLVCFIWFAFVGGTALDLELNGQAQGQILAADISAQLYAVMDVMLSPELARGMSVMIVLLLLTYLITSADSAVLVINTINAGGDTGHAGRLHIIIWGVALTVVIAALLLAGGLGAIKTAMIIGALPFSIIMVLMAAALIKALWQATRTAP